MKIAVLSMKGGVSKTTTAINLGVALGGVVAFIDLDQQESLLRYHHETPGLFECAPLHRLPKLLGVEADHVIVDCPPGFDSSQLLEVVRQVDLTLVTVQTEYDALIALDRTAALVAAYQWRAVLTMYSAGLEYQRAIVGEVRASYAAQTLQTIIPRRGEIGAACAVGKSVLSYAPTGSAAKAFRKLAREVSNVGK